jgi:quinol monooxygenase YgiN
MIRVIATVELNPEVREQFLVEFRQLVPLVRAEHGCIEYAAGIDVASQSAAQIPLREAVVTILEKWSDLPALQAHFTAPHMLAYRQRVAALVRRTTLQVLQSVD